MSPLYIIFRPIQDRVIEVIAWIEDDTLAGPEADLVCKQLEYWGYPAVALDEALDRWCTANPGAIGYSRQEIGEKES